MRRRADRSSVLYRSATLSVAKRGPLSYLRPMSSLRMRHRVRVAGFVEPCLPSLADKPPSGGDWIHEIKLDGYRLLAIRDLAGVLLYTRRGNNWTSRFPLAAAGSSFKELIQIEVERMRTAVSKGRHCASAPRPRPRS
jgi:ATP-dependent DNA ligase